jgi:hypothetical protein
MMVLDKLDDIREALASELNLPKDELTGLVDKLTYKTFHMFGTFGKMALLLKYLHSHNYGEYVRF